MEQTPEQYGRLKLAFNRAVDLSASEIEDFLHSSSLDSEMRRDLRKMLAVAQGNSISLDSPAYKHFVDTKIPEAIGGYRIIREIGNGGMGSVYEGLMETDAFTQRAAIKVIRNGMNNDIILRRFRSEQKILASLEHPNIARFLSGGTTVNGLPFYVMEFIEGSQITAFVRDNSLSKKDIAALFRHVCSAVSYAHSQLIVHRDLKPANILVTREGTPKLLDFGIAKMLEAETAETGTATQFGMMTPQYASPEQIRGEKVTTTSDVYSLGMIMYELLAGDLPYKTEKKTYAEIVELVSEKHLTGGHITKGKIGGDLERITSKALQSDPTRRYSSVEALSEDLRRHLSDLPIKARPDSFQYRASKFARRHSLAIAAGTLVFAALAAGVITTVWQARRAEQQRALAEKRFAEVRQLANNVVFKYHDEIAKLDGSTAVREMLVTDALTYLDALSADAGNDTALQKEIALAYIRLGDVQGKLYAANTGNSEGSLSSYRKAIAMMENVIASDPTSVEAKETLANAYDSLLFLLNRVKGDPNEKQTSLERYAALVSEITAARPDNKNRLTQLAKMYVRLGDAKTVNQKLDEHMKALPLAERLADGETKWSAALHMATVIYQRIGTDHIWLGQAAEKNNDRDTAKAEYSQALLFHKKMMEMVERMDIADAGPAETHRVWFSAWSSIAESAAYNGLYEEANTYANKCLALTLDGIKADKDNREGDMDMASIYLLKGDICLAAGKKKTFAENYRKALDIYNAVVLRDPNNAEAKNQIKVIQTKLASEGS